MNLLTYELFNDKQCTWPLSPCVMCSNIRCCECDRDKGSEPDDSVTAPVSKAELKEAAAASIAQRERDNIERMHRISSVAHK